MIFEKCPVWLLPILWKMDTLDQKGPEIVFLINFFAWNSITKYFQGEIFMTDFPVTWRRWKTRESCGTLPNNCHDDLKTD